MPDPMPDAVKPDAAPRAKASPPSEPPNPFSPPKTAAVGRLFRVLVEAGADAMPAYTVVEEAQAMALESAATQVQPMLVEMRQLFAERDRKFDQKIDELSRKVDHLSQDLASHKEVVSTKLDALKRELRLVWGALSVLVTLLIVVFGFVFGN